MLEGRPATRVWEAHLPGARTLLFAGGPSGLPPGQRPVQPQYQQQYPPQVPQAPDKESGIVLTILGVVVTLFTVLEFISSFLPWVTTGAVSNSGINLMTSRGLGFQGFFMIRWGWGGILFTGFFSLFFGALMLIPVILFLLNNPDGASWAIVLGVLVFFIALVNIIMVYSTLNASGVGAGLWVMLASAIVLLVCGIVALRFSSG